MWITHPRHPAVGPAPLAIASQRVACRLAASAKPSWLDPVIVLTTKIRRRINRKSADSARLSACHLAGLGKTGRSAPLSGGPVRSTQERIYRQHNFHFWIAAVLGEQGRSGARVDRECA